MITELVSDLKRFVNDNTYVTTVRVSLGEECGFDSLTVVYRITRASWPEWYSVSGLRGGAIVAWVSEGLCGMFFTRLELGTSQFHKRLERHVQNAASELV